MKTKYFLPILAFVAAAGLLPAQESPPPSKDKKPAGIRSHVLPPGAVEKLKLTADQQKELAAIEADVKARLEKLLTPEQVQQLQQMRPPHKPRAGVQGGPGAEHGPEGGQPPATPSGK